jgi:hypothetical protein
MSSQAGDPKYTEARTGTAKTNADNTRIVSAWLRNPVSGTGSAVAPFTPAKLPERLGKILPGKIGPGSVQKDELGIGQLP